MSDTSNNDIPVRTASQRIFLEGLLEILREGKPLPPLCDRQKEFIRQLTPAEREPISDLMSRRFTKFREEQARLDALCECAKMTEEERAQILSCDGCPKYRNFGHWSSPVPQGKRYLPSPRRLPLFSQSGRSYRFFDHLPDDTSDDPPLPCTVSGAIECEC
jgi:hypothetical protein